MGKGESRLKLVSPLIMWAIVAVGVAVVFRLVPNVILFSGKFTRILLVPAAANWVYMFLGAVKINRRPAQSAASVSSLATDGVYARVRHPIYSADIVLAWAVFLSSPTLKLLVGVAWGTIVLISWMKMEESALEQRFGSEYSDYKSRTPMMFPKRLR